MSRSNAIRTIYLNDVEAGPKSSKRGIFLGSKAETVYELGVMREEVLSRSDNILQANSLPPPPHPCTEEDENSISELNSRKPKKERKILWATYSFIFSTLIFMKRFLFFFSFLYFFLSFSLFINRQKGRKIFPKIIQA